MFRGMLVMLVVWRCAAAGEVQVEIEDDAVNHAHPAGQPFTIHIRIDHGGPGVVRYHWCDFRGRPLTEPEPLESRKTTAIAAPDGHTGYLGLVLAPSTPELVLPNRAPGEQREYGFALLPAAARAHEINPASPFGMVHARTKDPYLEGWVKTMTWETASPKWWAYEIEKRRSRGMLELPIVDGDGWKTDDTRPISPAELDLLGARIKRYFAAHPATRYWELGIEENLSRRFKQPYYWPNLAAKVRVVRKAADEINPDIRLVYQIAELRMKAIRKFLQDPVAREFDILSLHPYAWPDFPSPEEWLDDFIDEVRSLMHTEGLNMPIWFTEVGVPHHGNRPGEFFGYPKKRARVEGKTPYEAVVYMLKLHVMAFSRGVEKIFWYNYMDRKPGRDFAENHFGLLDYWGFPKPVYPAYMTMQALLDTREAGPPRQVAENVRVYDFRGQDTNVAVAWAYPGGDREIPLGRLIPGASSGDVLRIVDPMGEAVSRRGASIPITGLPV
ncbi:MAG: hypothetical protein PVF08_05630, partial [Gammaproteobacteria bacterium]